MVTEYKNTADLMKALMKCKGGVNVVTKRLDELGPITRHGAVYTWEESLGMKHLACNIANSFQFGEEGADQLAELVDLAASSIRLAEDLAMRLTRKGGVA
jgi:hypothetical protein